MLFSFFFIAAFQLDIEWARREKEQVAMATQPIILICFWGFDSFISIIVVNRIRYIAVLFFGSFFCPYRKSLFTYVRLIKITDATDRYRCIYLGQSNGQSSQRICAKNSNSNFAVFVF